MPKVQRAITQEVFFKISSKVNLKTAELLDCALIGVYAVIR